MFMDFKIIEYSLLGLFVVIVAVCLILTIVKAAKKKKDLPIKVNPVETSGGVRYTPTDEIATADGEMKVSYIKEDIILQPRKMVLVGKKCPIKPGKYSVLSAYENETEFNIRIGNFVKSYTHGQEIVLVEGDEICPTSSTIILR